jgi:glycosyltransferase involved in cell wall biosynthesis
VSDDELASLYRRASCLVFPSLYEGFGLPPLEAMACGCPVAASRAGALPEVCGDAAVLFDPLHPEAIAAGVEEALERAPELSARGPAHAAAFTWEESARRHDAVYRGVAA